MTSNFKDFKAFADEVMRVESAKQDYVVPMHKVAMTDHDHLAVETVGTFGLTDNGHRQLAEKIGIPWPYYERTSAVPALREYNVNAWARANPDDRHLIRTLDGNVRAVLGSKFKPMDNYALMDAIMPSLREVQAREELLVKTFALSENHLYLQIVFKNTVRDLVKPGEHTFLKTPIQIMAGMTIRNSETGHAARDFRRMVWNLVCWNGAIRESVLRNYHVGRELDGDGNGNIWTEETLRAEIELLRLKTRDIIRDAMDPAQMDTFVDKAKAALEDRIERPMDEVVVNVTKRFGLSKTEGQAMMENVLLGGEENKSRWGLANGINALAHTIGNVDRQYDVERWASEVIDLSPRDWKVLAA